MKTHISLPSVLCSLMFHLAQQKITNKNKVVLENCKKEQSCKQECEQHKQECKEKPQREQEHEQNTNMNKITNKNVIVNKNINRNKITNKNKTIHRTIRLTRLTMNHEGEVAPLKLEDGNVDLQAPSVPCSTLQTKRPQIGARLPSKDHKRQEGNTRRQPCVHVHKPQEENSSHGPQR